MALFGWDAITQRTCCWIRKPVCRVVNKEKLKSGKDSATEHTNVQCDSNTSEPLRHNEKRFVFAAYFLLPYTNSVFFPVKHSSLGSSKYVQKISKEKIHTVGFNTPWEHNEHSPDSAWRCYCPVAIFQFKCLDGADNKSETSWWLFLNES
jgi:hypothetical protein